MLRVDDRPAGSLPLASLTRLGFVLALWVGIAGFLQTGAQPALGRAPLTADTTSAIRADTLTLQGIAPTQLTPLTNEQAANRPYRQEPSVYMTAPALRYNRVEGAVVGLQQPPLAWTAPASVRLFGQVSYALALEQARYVAGVEYRPTAPGAAYGLKLGVHAGRTTASADQWKQSWEETSVSALIFGRDLFNYYDVRQATAYVIQRLGTRLQVSAGARWAEYGALRQRTSWSLLEHRSFRPNPAADEGTARLLLLSAEAGHLRHRSKHRPVGAIARLYTELGTPFGGSLGFNRYIADGQLYQPLTPSVNLNVRVRGGYATSGAPIQKQFRLDGVNGLRTYTPNLPGGKRLFLGGAQFAWHDGLPLSWLHPLQLSVFADAGWTGDSGFATGDTFAFAGIGAATFGRLIAIDVAWPLHRARTGPPQVSLKINPLR